MKELIAEVSSIMQEPPTSPTSEKYKRLQEIYCTIHNTQSACSDCDFYAILRYFTNLTTNNVYHRTNYKYKPVDKYLGQSFTLNGIKHTPEALTDETIEMLINSKCFYLGVHFEKITNTKIIAIPTEEFKPVLGDVTKEIQDPIKIKSNARTRNKAAK